MDNWLTIQLIAPPASHSWVWFADVLHTGEWHTWVDHVAWAAFGEGLLVRRDLIPFVGDRAAAAVADPSA